MSWECAECRHSVEHGICCDAARVELVVFFPSVGLRSCDRQDRFVVTSCGPAACFARSRRWPRCGFERVAASRRFCAHGAMTRQRDPLEPRLATVCSELSCSPGVLLDARAPPLLGAAACACEVVRDGRTSVNSSAAAELLKSATLHLEPALLTKVKTPRPVPPRPAPDSVDARLVIMLSDVTNGYVRDTSGILWDIMSADMGGGKDTALALSTSYGSKGADICRRETEASCAEYVSSCHPSLGDTSVGTIGAEGGLGEPSGSGKVDDDVCTDRLPSRSARWACPPPARHPRRSQYHPVKLKRDTEDLLAHCAGLREQLDNRTFLHIVPVGSCQCYCSSSATRC